MLITNITELEEYVVSEDNLLTQIDGDYLHWNKKIETIYRQTVENSKFTYRQYQVDYASIACLRRRNILAHSQGAGKTATAGLAIAALYPDINKQVSRVHVLVPNVLAAGRWLEDLNYIPNLKGLSRWITTGKQLDLAIKDQVPIFIYTYDFLRKVYKDKCVAKYFSKYLRPSMVIIDELHNLANPDSIRRKKVNILTRRVKRVLGLTGTISEGKLEQISSLCRLIYRSAWSYTDKEFVYLYGKKKKVETNYLTGTGETNRYLNQLDPSKVSLYYQTIRTFLHRVTLDDPDVKSVIYLPKQNQRIIEFELEGEHKELYNSYVNSYKEEIKLVVNAKGSNSSRFQALKLIYPLISFVNHCKDLKEESRKIKELRTALKDYKKVAIFCHQIESARYLEDSLEPDSVVRLYSQDSFRNPKVLPLDARYEVVRKFQKEEQIRVGIFSVGLAAESIDLTAADAVFFYCLPWQSIKVLQSVSRVVRPGNLNKEIDVLYFCHTNAIDKHQVNLTLQKIERTKMLLDYDGIEVTKDDSSGDLDPQDILSKIMESL